LDNVTIAECDSISIPVGAHHPNEAFEFIRYLCSQEGLEMLCMGQQKFTPLKKVSPEFVEKHPNEYIRLFIDLASSPNVCHAPVISIWFEYSDEIAAAFDLVMFGLDAPERAVAKVQDRVSAIWKRARESIERREKAEGRAAP
jgi:multiple sugar transport system substrate-binding protein